jgi:hypothetical protein
VLPQHPDATDNTGPFYTCGKAAGVSGACDLPKSEKDRIAKEVIEEWISFQMALSNKRKYPTAEFNFRTAFARYR